MNAPEMLPTATALIPHGMCFLWDRNLILLHTITDFSIGLSYCVIAALLYTLRLIFSDTLDSLHLSKWFGLFANFIFWCGMSHYLSVLVIWFPLYWLEGAVKAITAAVSVATAIALFFMLQQVVRSIRHLHPKGIA